MRASIGGDEASAIGSLRAINSAQWTFAASYGPELDKRIYVRYTDELA